MKNIAIFASGGGSNALKIYEYFKDNQEVSIPLVLTNNPKAGIIEKTKNWNTELIVFDRNSFYSSNEIVDKLIDKNIDLVVLAGFLWLIPENLLDAFPNKIVNIHPALLPKYGGKGMYGMNVHKAVFENKEKESGITIHLINEEYDKGEFLFQEAVDVSACASAEEIAVTVLKIEHKNFPRIIDKLLNE